MKTLIELERTKCAEDAGVKSSVVKKMTEDMSCNGINIHSIMILRHGKVAVESYSKPLTKDITHTAYSISKSFLSTAYGFALDEGKITKDTRFADVFPEYRNKKDKYLEKLTIDHLFCMQAGKQTSVRKIKVDSWFKSFLDSKWNFEPGTSWRYVSENYVVASAMLTRVLGQSVTEYLTPRLYEPLGIDVPFWERTREGFESGGWGIALKTEDIAKVILTYHNGGVFNGKQIIPEWWVERATSKISDTKDIEKEADSKAGYGYGFWQCNGANAFRMEGMYSQYAIALKDYDACIVVTSDHSDLQETLDYIWKYVPNMFFDGDSQLDSVSVELPDKSIVPTTGRSLLEKEIDGKPYKMRKCRFVTQVGYPVSVLTMPVVFFLENKGGNMTNLIFDFCEEGVVFSWEEDGNNKNSLFIAMNGKGALGKITIGRLTVDVRSYAYWENSNTLVMHIRPLSAVSERILKFEFNGKRIKMMPDSYPSTEENSKKVGDKLKCILKGRYFRWWIDFLVPRISGILNPTHYGRQD